MEEKTGKRKAKRGLILGSAAVGAVLTLLISGLMDALYGEVLQGIRRDDMTNSPPLSPTLIPCAVTAIGMLTGVMARASCSRSPGRPEDGLSALQ